MGKSISVLLLNMMHALDESRRGEVVALRDRFETGLRELVAEGVRTGEVRPLPPKLVAFAVFGAINWIARWYRTGGEATPEQIAEVFGDLFLGGLFVRARGAAVGLEGREGVQV